MLALCLFSASLYIQNASGIQIGSNNMMSIRGYDSSHSLLSQPGNCPAYSPIREGIMKYGKPEQHFFSSELDSMQMHHRIQSFSSTCHG